MKRRIKVKLPINLDKADICDFSNNDYEVFPLKVYKLSNVLVTREGVCLINSSPVLESIHGYRDKITISTLMAKLSLLQDKTLLLNNAFHYLLINGPLFSYFHWFTESIPRLLLVLDRIHDLVLLLPWEFKDVNFVIKSLMPFQLKKIEYIPPKTKVKVSHLVLPQLKPFSSIFYPEAVEEIRRIFIEYSGNKSGYEGLSTYIMLENSEGEKGITLSNQKMVDKVIKEYGIEKLDLLKHDFFDQVRILQNSRLVISVTSELLGSICFLKKGASMLELLMASYYEMDRFDLRFLNLSSNLGINYYYQFCTDTSSGQGFKAKSFKADISQLRKNLNLIFQNITQQ